MLHPLISLASNKCIDDKGTTSYYKEPVSCADWGLKDPPPWYESVASAVWDKFIWLTDWMESWPVDPILVLVVSATLALIAWFHFIERLRRKSGSPAER